MAHAHSVALLSHEEEWKRTTKNYHINWNMPNVGRYHICPLTCGPQDWGCESPRETGVNHEEVGERKGLCMKRLWQS